MSKSDYMLSVGVQAEKERQSLMNSYNAAYGLVKDIDKVELPIFWHSLAANEG